MVGRTRAARRAALPSMFLIAGLQLTALAQGGAKPSVLELYDRAVIYPLSPGRYVRNDTLYTGLSLMRNEFVISDGALKLYVRSQRNRTISLVVSLGVAVMPTRTAATFNKPFYQRPLYYVALGLGLASSAINARATSQLNQAVWLRNREALFLLDERK